MLINYLNASITMDGKSSNYPELQKFPLPWVAEVSITMDCRNFHHHESGITRVTLKSNLARLPSSAMDRG
jgi:hypothetical protein